MKLPDKSLFELDELCRSLEEMNGHSIRNDSTAVTLESLIGPAIQKKTTTLYGRTDASRIIASDASDKAACSYVVTGTEKFFLQKMFTQEEQRFSSGHRELPTVLRTLQAREGFFKSLPKGHRTIMWLTDSTNMVTFLTKGSTKRPIQKDVLQCFHLCQEIGIKIQPVHLSREDFRIQEADQGTRFFDPDDWSIDKYLFDRLTKNESISVDLFAHTTNTKVSRFYSYGLCPGSKGTDAFTQSWDNETAWACPPTSLVIDTKKKLSLIHI